MVHSTLATFVIVMSLLAEGRRKGLVCQPRSALLACRCVAGFVCGDRSHRASECGVFRALRLPHGDERAEGLVNAALHGVFARNLEEGAPGTTCRHGRHETSPLCLGKAPDHPGVPDLGRQRQLRRNHSVRGGTVGDEIVPQDPKRVDRRGLEVSELREPPPDLACVLLR
jgi:hypothetical protein